MEKTCFPLPLLAQWSAATQEATEEKGRHLAEILKPGDVLLLEGLLGAGKSTFARAVIRHLAGAPELAVPSPTFTLVQSYDAAAGFPVFHGDCYRLEQPEELAELGLDEAMEEGVCLIEWPGIAASLWPDTALWIGFEMGDGHSRLLMLRGREEWKSRLDSLASAA